MIWIESFDEGKKINTLELYLAHIKTEWKFELTLTLLEDITLANNEGKEAYYYH